MFVNKSKIPVVESCVNLANDLIVSSNFAIKLNNKKSFDMATCDGTRILSLYNQAIKLKKELYVYTYRSKNPFSHSLGYFNPSKPDNIYLNSKKLNRTRGSIVASLIHESVHWLDYYDKVHSFGHGDNSPQGKQNTAPYWIDNISEALLKGVEPNFNNNENKNIIVYIPWWKRIINWIF